MKRFVINAYAGNQHEVYFVLSPNTTQVILMNVAEKAKKDFKVEELDKITIKNWS